jgi:hypothetical protein
MIHYLVHQKDSYTVGWFLSGWGLPLARRFRILGYEGLPSLKQLPPGCYIFSNLDCLKPEGVEYVASIWDQLSRASDRARLLNPPRRTLSRFDLLRRLFEAGLNGFNVHLSHPLPRPRFPVFLRRPMSHDGPLGGLIHDREDLRAEIDRQGGELLVVEYCRTADRSGVHRKYSAFRVGDRIIPRHLIFSRNWVQKYPDLVDPPMIEEEMEYLSANPHEPEIRRVFELAGVDYGRMDYGVVDGRIQVWEINRNPIITLRKEEYAPAHLPAQELFVSRMIEALEALDLDPPGPPIPIN